MKEKKKPESCGLFYAIADGTKRTLTNADFATMNPDDMKGTKLEQLLAEALRLKQSH